MNKHTSLLSCCMLMMLCCASSCSGTSDPDRGASMCTIAGLPFVAAPNTLTVYPRLGDPGEVLATGEEGYLGTEISLGLDWIPIEADIESGDWLSHGDTWRLENFEEPVSSQVAVEGFGVLLFRRDGKLRAFGWGDKLGSTFPGDWGKFPLRRTKVGVEIEIGSWVGGDSLDYNAALAGIGVASACYSPPDPGAPDLGPRQIFYTKNDFIEAREFSIDAGVFKLAPAAPVQVMTLPQRNPSAFALDLTHGVMVLGWDGGVFQAMRITATRDIGKGTVEKIVQRDDHHGLKELRGPEGDAIVPASPVYSCSGFDPRRLMRGTARAR